MHVGRMLVAGCDVWLNNPIRPHEASGTSGMKTPLHGGLNLSILDGWWPEGFDGSNGWAIESAPTGSSESDRDAFDANSLYERLENEVVPLFYERAESGLPIGWIRRALRGTATLPMKFNSHRMVAEYTRKAYVPAHQSGAQ